VGLKGRVGEKLKVSLHVVIKGIVKVVLWDPLADEWVEALDGE